MSHTGHAAPGAELSPLHGSRHESLECLAGLSSLTHKMGLVVPMSQGWWESHGEMCADRPRSLRRASLCLLRRGLGTWLVCGRGDSRSHGDASGRGEAITLSVRLDLLKGAPLRRRAEVLSRRSSAAPGAGDAGAGRAPYTNICRRVRVGLSTAVDKDGRSLCMAGFGDVLSCEPATVYSALIFLVSLSRLLLCPPASG